MAELSYALTDSPVSQMAWIVEKFKDWTGSDGVSNRSPSTSSSGLLLREVRAFYVGLR